MQAAVETRPHVVLRPVRRGRGRAPPRRARRPRRAAHDVVHRRARDVGAAARPRAGRHGRRARRSGSSPPRSPSRAQGAQAPLLRHRARDARPRSRPPRRADGRLRCAPSCRSTTPASAATSAGIERRARPGRAPQLVEDNAHGLFGSYRGRPLGSFGRFATLSFHETKNFICGEGGALVVNDERDVDRAHVLYDKGTNRRAFLHGQVDKYSWQDVGSSFGLGEVLAAFLYGQLEQRDVILAQAPGRLRPLPRAARAARRRARAPAARSCPPTASRRTTCSTCCSPTDATRDAVLAAMREHGVHADVPLRAAAQLAGRASSSPPGATECPVTDDISGRLLRLPFYNNLSVDDAGRVVDVLLRVLRRGAGAELVG